MHRTLLITQCTRDYHQTQTPSYTLELCHFPRLTAAKVFLAYRFFLIQDIFNPGYSDTERGCFEGRVHYRGLHQQDLELQRILHEGHRPEW